MNISPRALSAACAALLAASFASAQQAAPDQKVLTIPTVLIVSPKLPTLQEQQHYRILRAERTASYLTCKSAGTSDTECLYRHGGWVIGLNNVHADVTAELQFQKGRAAGSNSARFARYFDCVNKDFKAKDEESVDVISGNLNYFDSRHNFCLDMVNAGCEKACVKDWQLYSDAPIGAVPVEDFDGVPTVEDRLPAAAPPPAPPVQPVKAQDTLKKWQDYVNPCDGSAREDAHCWDR